MTHRRLQPAALMIIAILVVHEARGAPSCPHPPEGQALIPIRINADYRDTPEALRLLQTALQLPIAKQVSVRSGTPLSRIIVDNYGFGPGKKDDAIQSYRLIEERIVKLNGLLDADSLKAGSLLIPDLPTRALQSQNPENPWYGVPIVDVGCPGEVVEIGGENILVYRMASTIDREQRRAAKNSVLYRWMPKPIFDRVKEIIKPTSSEISGRDVQPASGAIPVPGSELPRLNDEIPAAASPPPSSRKDEQIEAHAVKEMASDSSSRSTSGRRWNLFSSPRLLLPSAIGGRFPTEAASGSAVSEEIMSGGASPAFSGMAPAEELPPPSAPELSPTLQVDAVSGLDIPAGDPFNSTFELEYEQTPSTLQPSEPFSKEELALVANKLSSAPDGNRSLVVVLDDAWPDQAAFVRSRDFITQKVAWLSSRDQLNLGLPCGDMQASSHPSTTFPSEYFHARDISESLSPLVAVDSKRVNVIYIPITRSPSGADKLLELIVQFDMTSKLLAASRPSVPLVDPCSMLNKSQRLAARTKVKQLPAEFTGRSAKTDAGILQSVLTFLQVYSERTETPVFITTSWTAPSLTYSIDFSSVGKVIVVAATGNKSGLDVNHFKIDFSRRAQDQSNILAVMNMRRDGTLDPTSSLVGMQRPQHQFAVGFDGYLRPGVSGTSFSTPRVAWLLAAREVTKPAAEQQSTWAVDLKDFLRSIRPKNAAGAAQFRLQIDCLFSEC